MAHPQECAEFGWGGAHPLGLAGVDEFAHAAYFKG